MFQKIVAIEPVNLLPAAKECLHEFAKEVVLYDSLPRGRRRDHPPRRRRGRGPHQLHHPHGPQAVTGCPNLRYIGMCCSLYEEKSANVDIAAAREKGHRRDGREGLRRRGRRRIRHQRAGSLSARLRPEAVARRSDGDHRPEGGRHRHGRDGYDDRRRAAVLRRGRALLQPHEKARPSRRRTATAGWSFRSFSRTATRFSPA